MAAEFSTFDFDQYVFTYNTVILSGFADGTSVTLVKEADDFTDTVGIGGHVTRSKSLDNRYTITVSLMQTSAANAQLAAYLEADKSLPNGAGVGVFMIKDTQGTELFVGAQAWIQKAPDWNFESGPTKRDWVFRVAHGTQFPGGI